MPKATPEVPSRVALQRYSDLLLQANQVMNLTACRDPAELWDRHILDSLSLLPHLPVGARIVDIGSGGGFPAIPIAIARADLMVTMVEATGKKCGFLQSVVDDMNLRNARVLHARSETVAHERDHREVYTCCTARAVSALRVLLELTLPFVRVGGVVLAMKGLAAQDEIRSASNALRLLGGGRPEILRVPDTESGACIVKIPKVAPTPSRYPRLPGKPAAEPL